MSASKPSIPRKVLYAQFKSTESVVISMLLAALVPRGTHIAQLAGTTAHVSKYINQGAGALTAVAADAEDTAGLAAKVAAKGSPFPYTSVAVDVTSWSPDTGLALPTVDVVTAWDDTLGSLWQSESTARAGLAAVAAMLRPGGVFCGATVDSATLWYKAQKSSTVTIANFRGALYRVEFESNSEMEVYGARATVLLGDDDERDVTLVHFATLIKIAAEVGLYVVDIQNALDVWADQSIHYPEIVKAFAVFGNIDTLHHDVVDALRLFTTFVFRKA